MSDLFDHMSAPIAPKPSALDMAREGMIRAIDHADRVRPGWSDRAYQMLVSYAQENFEFMTEDVRVWAHGHGLEPPPDGRAWGAVTLRAIKAGVLKRDRFRKTRIPPAHACDRPVWRSPLYGGGHQI